MNALRIMASPLRKAETECAEQAAERAAAFRRKETDSGFIAHGVRPVTEAWLGEGEVATAVGGMSVGEGAAQDDGDITPAVTVMRCAFTRIEAQQVRHRRSAGKYANAKQRAPPWQGEKVGGQEARELFV
jgi:hypothetical protein